MLKAVYSTNTHVCVCACVPYKMLAEDGNVFSFINIA